MKFVRYWRTSLKLKLRRVKEGKIRGKELSDGAVLK